MGANFSFVSVVGIIALVAIVAIVFGRDLRSKVGPGGASLEVEGPTNIPVKSPCKKQKRRLSRRARDPSEVTDASSRE